MPGSNEREIVVAGKHAYLLLASLLVLCFFIFVIGYLLGRRHGTEAAKQDGSRPVLQERAQPRQSPRLDAEAPVARKKEERDIRSQLRFQEEVIKPSPSPARITVLKNNSNKDSPKQLPAQGRTYSVQVSAFTQRAQGEALVADLRRRGYNAYLEPPAGPQDEYYRVKVGRMRSRQEAAALADRLRRDGFQVLIK